ncbi:MAG: hypothetical protein F9B45_28985 [Phycisphaera sp. RhM]|nr:hypothetical protein [Phycisphaera sp. RhM]
MSEAATIEGPKLDINLPRLAQSEIESLVVILSEKENTFPQYCRWILDQLVVEIERRETPGSEPAMIEPPMFGPLEMADMLIGSYCFVRFPMTDNQHKFLDDVDRHLVANASSLLEQIGERLNG